MQGKKKGGNSAISALKKKHKGPGNPNTRRKGAPNKGRKNKLLKKLSSSHAHSVEKTMANRVVSNQGRLSVVKPEPKKEEEDKNKKKKKK